MRNLKTAIVSVAMMGFAVTALNAQIVTLHDNNSTAVIDTGSQAGMNFWNVEPSGASQLAQQWFWYRIGSGQQYSIDTIGPAINSATANSLTTTYMNSLFSISITYSLTGSGIGTGQADIQEGIQITNLNSSSALNLSFFEYNHFQLLGISGGDSLTMDGSSALQSKGPNQIAEGIVAPDASHHEANTNGIPGSTLFNLNNTPGYNLNDHNSALGDVTWAFQWDFSVATSESISKDKLLSIQFVPEPSVVGFAVLGLGIHLLRRRSRR